MKSEREQMIEIVSGFVKELEERGKSRDEACKLIRHATYVVQNSTTSHGNSDGEALSQMAT